MTVPTTEQPNELACDIDAGTASDIVRTLGKCDSQIFHGWNNFPSIYDKTTISSMQKIAKRAVEVLQDSSDTAIVLSGCGTSGRLAFFLAQKFSELAKAQTLPARYEYVIAGGDIALFTSQEASEDDWKKGQEDLAKVSRHKTRVLFIGITCGFSAPYVAGQLDYCMSHPDVFIPVLLGFNPVNQARKNIIEGWNKSFFDVAKSLADCNKGIILNPVVGPEAITGSSRMKGGSATKIILETILLQAHFTLSRPTSPPAIILNELLSMFETTYSSTYLDGSKLAGAVKIAAESLQDKGHVYYVGFGLPGFMGLLDASECVPTFSAKFSDVRGFIKGGYRALKNKEGELQLDGSNPLLISLKDFVCKFLPKLMSCDTVVFICPDVKDIQEVEIISQLIDQKGAQIIGIVHEKEKHFSDLFMKSIVYIKQPSRDKKVLLCKPGFTSFVEECLTEISVKWILNAISTGAHVLKGKVVGSFMIDVKVSNNKLFHRAVSIISKFARVDQEKALCAVLQSIYRTDMIDNVLDKLVSEHVARGTVVEQVVPVAVLLATNMFTVDSALEVLTTKTVSYVLRNLSQS